MKTLVSGKEVEIEDVPAPPKLNRAMRRKLAREGVQAKVAEHEERLARLDRAVAELLSLLIRGGYLQVTEQGIEPVPLLRESGSPGHSAG